MMLFNWNTAFSLGACTLVVYYASWKWINTAFQFLTQTMKPWQKAVFGIFLTFVVVSGISLAVVMLGVVEAYVLKFFGFPQSVIIELTLDNHG